MASAVEEKVSVKDSAESVRTAVDAPTTPSNLDSEDEKKHSPEKEQDKPDTGLSDEESDQLEAQPVLLSNAKWYNKFIPPPVPPPPAPKTFEESGIIPLANCSLLSYMTYAWCHPIMSLGYKRPLEPTDLWAIDEKRSSAVLSANLDASWARRVAECEAFNLALSSGTQRIPLKVRMRWLGKGKEDREELEREYRGFIPDGARKEGRKSGKGWKRPSLTLAINEQFILFYHSAGIFKIIGDTCQLMSPLVSKALIVYAKEVYAARAAGEPRPSVGRGVAMAFGMYLLTAAWSICQHQVWWRGMMTGVLMRAALTCSVYKKALVLSNNSRATFSNGKLMNHLSTDISRIDYNAMWFTSIWTSPVQIAICTILLCLQIGPSALAGLAFFFIIIPIQSWVMQKSIRVRLDSMQYSDKRSKLLQELLGAMRVIKYFCFEQPYEERIDDLRKNELRGIRTLLMIRAGNQAVAFSLPVLSAVIAFVCYAGLGHSLDPTKIFTALSYFQLLRQPLMLLPTALSAATDAWNAVTRLTELFEAETMDTTIHIHPEQKAALVVADADFEWCALPEEENIKKPSKKEAKKAAKKAAEVGSVHEDVDAPQEPFRIENMNFEVPRGKLVAFVGPVGSGKSSLLQGLIGEMKLASGKVSFGTTVAYCPQTAWIQNATVRENVIFGQPFEEERYWDVIKKACLIADYEMLPDGDLTEIGEKGINLSGGQKQRVNVARALYFNADTVIFDDPLSALDAHVGKTIFDEAIVGLRNAGKTVILVTHALHFLSEVDYVYTLQDGRIVEHGVYHDLMVANGAFSELMRDFGGEEEEKHEEEEGIEAEAVAGPGPSIEAAKKKAEVVAARKEEKRKAEGTGKAAGKLIVNESRIKGTIENKVYSAYSKAANGSLLLPIIAVFTVIMQTAQVLSSYWLVWWQEDHFNQPQGFYMGIYAFLGVFQAIFTFLLGGAMGMLSFYASRNLHKEAIKKIFYAPMSYFDTVPLGRVMGVFGKDFDTIDNILPESLRNVIMTIASVLGSIILIAVFEQYFLIAAAAVIVGYRYYQRYYQASGRELKRIDSMLRSLLYSHFSESLSGLSTIRAYGVSSRFIKENEYRMDLEDRAYVLYCTTQRWLAVRLDAMGAVLIFVVAILVSVGPAGISPNQVGLLLTYTVTLVQMFGMLTRQSAEVENNLNGVERITVYTSDSLPQEKAYTSANPPAASWPDKGSVEMKDVVMAYRPGLPPVLKGISLHIEGGQKIGVVGRTGAGKSSIMSAIFRIVELNSGSISIDGIDISQIGLKELRTKVVMIPQDPLLFSGTMRSNLDPFNLYQDADLWSAMKRAHLVTDGTASPGHEERFTLDTVIDEEGNNLSVGQRSLVSLARALVRKEAKVVILDEATAAVDLETDSKIQATIRGELNDKTLLCIAHRLRTIIFYDKILVLDAGNVAEFDTPLALFQKEDSIFRSMCVKSSITEEDIRLSKTA